MRESWTDARLDDFAAHTDRRFERLEGRLDDLHQTMLLLGGGAIATIAVGFVGVIATQL